MNAVTVENGDTDQCNDNNVALDERVLSIVRNSPKLTIRPAKLTSELGISIEEASAELSGLMSAVGSTASFRFESISSGDNNKDENGVVREEDGERRNSSSNSLVWTMVFQFPEDFEQRARNSRRTKNSREFIYNSALVVLKLARVFVAFGLIVSLVVVLVAGLCAAFAVVIALARAGNNHRHRHSSMVMLRMLTGTLRELLFCFVVFGPAFQTESNMGEAETAMNVMYLLLGPGSPWFWMRLWRMNRRRRQPLQSRRWGGSRSSMSESRGERWGSEERGETVGLWGDGGFSRQLMQQQEQRGILSIAVEFLFGPIPFSPGPSETARWKMRHRVLVSMSSKGDKPGVSLMQILPFVDLPPPVPVDGDQKDLTTAFTSSPVALVSEALKIVTHFNGVPVKIIEDGSSGFSASNSDMSKARFVFPELMSEEATGAVGFGLANDETRGEEENDSWDSFFYMDEKTLGFRAKGTKLGGITTKASNTNTITQLEYLKEMRHVLTHLTRTQFCQCCMLNTINAVGIWMLLQSIGPGGLLEIVNADCYVLVNAMLCFLLFYAKLFFALPLARMIVIMLLNVGIAKRNQRRKVLTRLE